MCSTSPNPPVSLLFSGLRNLFRGFFSDDDKYFHLFKFGEVFTSHYLRSRGGVFLPLEGKLYGTGVCLFGRLFCHQCFEGCWPQKRSPIHTGQIKGH